MVGKVVSLSTALANAGQKPLSSSDNPSTDPFTVEFNAYVQELLEEWKIPGLSIAVVDGDKTYAKGFGYATLPDVKVTPETLFWAGSTTKAHTAAVLSRMIHSKKYSEFTKGWSTPISTIIPDDFVMPDPWLTAHLTLDDAASHRTGSSRHDHAWTAETNGKMTTVKDTTRNLRNIPVPADPRVQLQYCNRMYSVLGHVIESVTGQWVGDILKELLWKPLGMTATFLKLQDAKDAPERLSSSYWWNIQKGRYEETHTALPEVISAPGGIVTNVLDYAKWLKCLIHKAEPFSEIEHEDIRTPRILDSVSSGNIQTYGLGWIRKNMHGHVAYEHNGSVGTFGSDNVWLPEIEFGVVVLGNGLLYSSLVAGILSQVLVANRLNISNAERVDYNAKHKAQVTQQDQNIKNARAFLYPYLLNQPLPSPVLPSRLVGNYFDMGYGNITLQERRNPENSDDSILVAARENAVYPYEYHLYHVSGDYWILYEVHAETGLVLTFQKARFQIGPNGNPAALEIQYRLFYEEIDEGTVIFKRTN